MKFYSTAYNSNYKVERNDNNISLIGIDASIYDRAEAEIVMQEYLDSTGEEGEVGAAYVTDEEGWWTAKIL